MPRVIRSLKKSVSGSTGNEFTNLFYVVHRLAGDATARTAVGVCLGGFNIIAVDQQALLVADQLPGTDFEDNVCIACAMQISADWIVTRDAAGFNRSSVPAISPADLMKLLPK